MDTSEASALPSDQRYRAAGIPDCRLRIPEHYQPVETQQFVRLPPPGRSELRGGRIEASRGQRDAERVTAGILPEPAVNAGKRRDEGAARLAFGCLVKTHGLGRRRTVGIGMKIVNRREIS